VLNIATGALVVASLVCGFASGLAIYAIGISIWGLFYAAYAGTYDSVIYDVVVEETASADSFEHFYGRWQMFDSVAFITSALLSAAVARFADLRVAYLLTVPLTCCAFVTLSRFREPNLHRKVPPAHLTAHFGRILRGTTKANVTWIVLALVANCVVMRLMIEFYQFWYLGLALPAVLYGPACAVMYCGVWGGGALADRLRGWRTATVAAFVTLGFATGLFLRSPGLVIGAQVGTIMGVTVLNIVLTRHLHDTMPSNIRAGASSLVSTMGYGVFVPTALGFGLVSRARGIFEAAIFVAVPLGVVCVSVVRTRFWIHRPYPQPVSPVTAAVSPARGPVGPAHGPLSPVRESAGPVNGHRLPPGPAGPAGPFPESVRKLHAQRT
jgi:hypothetical protein